MKEKTNTIKRDFIEGVLTKCKTCLYINNERD